MQSPKCFVKMIAIILLTVIVLLRVAHFDSIRAKGTPEPLLGKPTEHSVPLATYQSSIDQIAESSESIYVLYDDTRGIVQVYDLEGNFQKALTFHCHMNGVFRIAVVDNNLLVRDKYGNIYSFCDDAFASFWERGDVPFVLETVDFEAQSKKYEVRFGSIWEANEGNICVIQRPLYACFFQKNVRTIIFIGFMIAILLVYYIWKRRKRV